MPVRDRIIGNRAEIVAIAARHGASNVRLFGSVARGAELPSSDVDFLVALERGRTLFDIARLEEELSSFLGCSVDVATEGELADNLARTVPREALAL